MICGPRNHGDASRRSPISSQGLLSRLWGLGCSWTSGTGPQRQRQVLKWSVGGIGISYPTKQRRISLLVPCVSPKSHTNQFSFQLDVAALLGGSLLVLSPHVIGRPFSEHQMLIELAYTYEKLTHSALQGTPFSTPKTDISTPSSISDLFPSPFRWLSII